MEVTEMVVVPVAVINRAHEALRQSNDILEEAQEVFRSIDELCALFDPAPRGDLDAFEVVARALIVASSEHKILPVFEAGNSTPIALFDVLGNFYAGADMIQKTNELTFDRGYDEGFEVGRDKSFDAGFDAGFDYGKNEGEAEGFDEGYKAGKPLSVKKLVGAIGATVLAMLTLVVVPVLAVLL